MFGRTDMFGPSPQLADSAPQRCIPTTMLVSQDDFRVPQSRINIRKRGKENRPIFMGLDEFFNTVDYLDNPFIGSLHDLHLLLR